MSRQLLARLFVSWIICLPSVPACTVKKAKASQVFELTLWRNICTLNRQLVFNDKSNWAVNNCKKMFVRMCFSRIQSFKFKNSILDLFFSEHYQILMKKYSWISNKLWLLVITWVSLKTLVMNDMTTFFSFSARIWREQNLDLLPIFDATHQILCSLNEISTIFSKLQSKAVSSKRNSFSQKSVFKFSKSKI